MNFNKFFELAKEKGISESQIQISKSSSLSFELFQHELDSYEVQSSQSIVACGIYNGKFGSARTERLDSTSFSYLIDQIIVSASVSEKSEAASIFKGSEKYKKVSYFNKSLGETPVEEKIAACKKLEDLIYAGDPSVSEVQVGYSESSSSSEFYNSYGLKQKQKDTYYTLFGMAVARRGEEIKNNFELDFGNDFSNFKPEEFAKKIVTETVKKFGAKSIKSGKYPTVLKKSIVASLVRAFLSSAVADEVQRHSSFLEGKLGEKVACSKLTVEEKPLTKNIFASYFDDEGVAKTNKVIVKNGVLKQYFYNRETGAKDGVESTGNGAWQGGKIGTNFSNIFVKPGKVSFDELIAPIEEGVYITEIQGLGTGLNPNSGNFSCQAEGYMIRGGKIAEPITLITMSGNLLKMFKSLKGFDKEAELTLSSVTCGNAYIKSMSIGGE